MKLFTTFVGKVFPLSGRINTYKSLEYRIQETADSMKTEGKGQGNPESWSDGVLEHPPSPRLQRTGWSNGKTKVKTSYLSPACPEPFDAAHGPVKTNLSRGSRWSLEPQRIHFDRINRIDRMAGFLLKLGTGS